MAFIVSALDADFCFRFLTKFFDRVVNLFNISLVTIFDISVLILSIFSKIAVTVFASRSLVSEAFDAFNRLNANMAIKAAIPVGTTDELIRAEDIPARDRDFFFEYGMLIIILR